mgnify:CR=1 FL=1
MDRARRLLGAILAFAMVQFGAVATAPAHAHAAGDSHGVRELSVAHDHAHEGPDLAVLEQHADHDVSGAADGDAPSDENDGDLGANERAAHVHNCPQFTHIDAGGLAPVAQRVTKEPPPVRYQHIASRAPAPPLRPPRILL